MKKSITSSIAICLLLALCFPAAGSAEPGKNLWANDLGQAATWSSPVVVGDKVFLQLQDGGFVCLEASTGNQVWVNEETGMSVASPVYQNGKLYVVAENKFLEMDPETGAITGEFMVEHISTKVPAVTVSTAFFADTTNFYALDLSTFNTVLWSKTWNSSFYNINPIVEDGIVYVMADKLYAWDAETGEEYWNVAPPKSDGFYLGALQDGILAVFSRYDYDAGTELYAYELANNRKNAPNLLWTASMGKDMADDSPPAMDSGWIYAITRSGVLNAFTVDGTGTPTWTREVRPNTSGMAPPLPIAVGGKVFIQDDALLTVVCLDGASGQLLWQGDVQVAGMVWSSPVLVDQILYIAADMGGAYAFDAEGAEGAWYMMKQNPSLTSSNTGWGPVTFTGKPVSGETPLTVKFQDKTPGSVTSRTWDFGDGGTSTQKNPNHTYQTAGTYAVTLRVEGPGGGDALTRNDFITVTASTKGALTVTLTPPEAVTAGARWRVDGGSWMSSGQTMTGLAKGKHTVEFLQVEGWTTPKSQTVTITPNKTAKATGVYKSSLPSVSIQAVQETVPETGKSAGAFKVTRTGNTQKSLVVYYSIGGTAKNGRDYKKLTGKVTIPAKKAFATILVRPIDNKTDGTDKTVVLTLKANKSYQVGTPSSATITIADNEA